MKGGYRSTAMDTLEPSTGIPEEQSPGGLENEPDFTIAGISRQGFSFHGKVPKRSDSRKEDFPLKIDYHGRCPPDRVSYPHGVDSLDRKQFPDRQEALSGQIPSTEISRVGFSDRGCHRDRRKSVLLRFPT